MEASVPTPSILADPSGKLVADISCRRCAYNLRGLNQGGLCPECNTPVAVSMQGDLLRFADPDWVAALAKGAKFLLWGLAVAVLVSMLGGVLMTLVSPVLGGLVAFLGSLLAYYAVWLLTVSDPSGTGESRYVTARKLIRGTLLISMSADLLTLAVKGLPPLPVIAITIMAVALFAGLARLVFQFAIFVYLEKLALRVPDEKLAGRARFLRWAIGISFLIVILGGVVMGVAAFQAGGTVTLTAAAPGGITMGPTGPPGAPLSGFEVAGGCIASVVFLALLVFGLMTLRLIYRMGKVFREQAELARANWSAVARPAV